MAPRLAGCLCGALVAALVAAAVAATPASADWGAPFALSSSGQNATNPQVAVDDDGDAVFVWERVDASGDLRIQARARSAAGSLSPVQTLSDAGQDASLPQVAVDADGDAVFAWRRYDGTSDCGGVGCFRIQARARSAAGTLSAVQTLSTSGRNADSPQVAVDPTGDAVVTWSRYDGTNVRIQARARSAAGALSFVQTLSPSGQNAFNPQVAVDTDGDAVFTWERYDGANTRVQTRTRSAASAFLSPVQTLSDAGQSAVSPQVAVDDDGDAVFTWRRFDGSGTFCCSRAQARARSAAGTLSPVQTLSTAGGDAFSPHVAVDPDGDAVFTWERSDGSGSLCCSRVQTKARSAAGTLSAVQTLSEAGQNAQSARVAVDTDGDAVFTWSRSDGTNFRVQARTRSASGALSRPVQTLSSAGEDAKIPQVAVDATGDAVATWRRSDGANQRIQGVVGP
jgi:uncharacterized protein GlcG (DUF336 family)